MMCMTGRWTRLIALSIVAARLLLFGVCAAEAFGHAPDPAEAADQTIEQLLAVPAEHLDHFTHDLLTIPDDLAVLDRAEAPSTPQSILLALSALVRDGPSSRFALPLFQLFSVYRL